MRIERAEGQGGMGMKPSQRLVCHSCGYRYPFQSAGTGCCKTPDLHLHSSINPCRWCECPKCEGRGWIEFVGYSNSVIERDCPDCGGVGS